MGNNNEALLETESRESLLALLEDMAKRWLAHDGLWFQAVEKEYGMEAAIAKSISDSFLSLAACRF